MTTACKFMCFAYSHVYIGNFITTFAIIKVILFMENICPFGKGQLT